MPDVQCTPLADQGIMRVWVDWSDDPHPDAPLKVERLVSGSDPIPVRNSYEPLVPTATGGGAAVLHVSTCGQLMLWDTTAPMDVPVSYRVTDDPFGDTFTSAACVLASGSAPWLQDPRNPCRNIKLSDCDGVQACPNPAADDVVFIRHTAETYASVSAQFSVFGSRRPIDVSQVRQDAVTTLFFGTFTCAGRDRLLALTAPGTPVYMPSFEPICWPGRYLAVGDHEVSPLSRDLRRQERLHTLPVVAVDAPAGPVCCVSGVGWCEMCACAETWDEFDARNLTGRQVLEGAGTQC